MSDTKSKLPDMKELTSITKKFFSDMKTSVDQIIKDYKEVRAKQTMSEEAKSKTTAKTKKEEESK